MNGLTRRAAIAPVCAAAQAMETRAMENRVRGVVWGGFALAATAAFWGVALADPPPGEQGAADMIRVTQREIEDGTLRFSDIRAAGLLVFTTPYNKLDGYGDGPSNFNDTVSPGGRPTLQGNGTFLRANGLDAQTCLECHAIVSNARVPALLGIGGVGGSVTNAMIMPTAMDPSDQDDLDGIAGFNGRFANPPFLFGAGAVELLGLEMTEDLQALKAQAIARPGVPVALATHGVDFGTIVADLHGHVDTSGVEGVDDDLVIKPFGRKGEFPTTRDFDLEAMQFHLGMQPVEVVGQNIDADGDGVMNEVRIGEHSALHVFAATLARPTQDRSTPEINAGFAHFNAVGCADCHMPSIETRGKELPLRFPMNPVDPWTDVYMQIDLTDRPMRFAENVAGGITVPLFADLKRHDMGDALAESFGLVGEERNREFTTARLWGIADTAPYLHDGRATTLTEAIELHGGAAQGARDSFVALSDTAKTELLTFLRSLRTPEDPLNGRQNGRRRPNGQP
ncbi:MAG TPA: di-heme oxidoredictase family protein [Woeseiaceae bacterium]|nr:di-heme oxidoredictase family protein [Woeseiaceae bacterium]